LLVFHAGNVIVADCPWLAPQAMRGKRNEPSFPPMIAQEIANLKCINVDDLAETTTRNTEEILKLTKKTSFR